MKNLTKPSQNFSISHRCLILIDYALSMNPHTNEELCSIGQNDLSVQSGILLWAMQVISLVHNESLFCHLSR